MTLASSLPDTCANSSRARIVPFARAAALSAALTVVRADCNRLSRTWLAALDHTETPSFCAVVLPLVDSPETLRPIVSSPVSDTRGPANPETTPKVQCGQSLTPIAAAVAALHPSRVPPLATLAGMRAAT